MEALSKTRAVSWARGTAVGKVVTSAGKAIGTGWRGLMEWEGKQFAKSPVANFVEKMTKPITKSRRALAEWEGKQWGKLGNSLKNKFSEFGDFFNGRKTIEIYGFRGTGDLANAGEQTLLATGHVGISFDRGKTIFGFNPERPLGTEKAKFMKRIRDGEAFPGKVTNDTNVFRKAENLGFDVRRTVYKVEPEIFERVRSSVIRDFIDSPLNNKFYSFPDKKLGGFGPNCYNCATYPVSVGFETPYPSGKLGDYLPKNFFPK